MVRRPLPTSRQLVLPLPGISPSPDKLRAKWAELIERRKTIEQQRILRDSRVEFEQLPN